MDKRNFLALGKSQKLKILFNRIFIEDFKTDSNNNSRKKVVPNTGIITKFLCILCPKIISDNDNAILCDLCQT